MSAVSQIRIDANGPFDHGAALGTLTAYAVEGLHRIDPENEQPHVNAHLGRDSVFAEQIKSRPGIRNTRFHAPFEAAILTVLGQQVTLATGSFRSPARRHFPLLSGTAPLSNFKALHKLQRIKKLHKLHKTSKAPQRHHPQPSPTPAPLSLIFAQSFHPAQSYAPHSPACGGVRNREVVAVVEGWGVGKHGRRVPTSSPEIHE